MALVEFARLLPSRLADAENRAPFDGGLYLFKQFYPATEADVLYTSLLAELDWQEESLFIYGRWLKVPRLMAWYGDPEACYRYSGRDHLPMPWHPALLTVKNNLEQYCDSRFNSVLANLYRNGNDSMGCHADDEKELGPQPLIASLSLGAERLFKLRHKKRGVGLDIKLAHGDLVVMAGVLQQHWQHSVPKTKKLTAPRINLTFRQIVAKA